MLLADPEANLEPLDWASNNFLLVERVGDDAQGIYLYSFDEDELRPWVTTDFEERAATASPDDRFAAYVSNGTGRNEVWVQTFPDPGTRWRVSVDGGDWPTWRSDGNEIYYVDPAGRLTAVPVGWRDGEDGRVPEFGAPQPLFSVDLKNHDDRQYDTLDGETFLINRVVFEGADQPLTLIQNWK